MATGLISNAFVIGTVGAAVYRTEEGLRALSLDENGGYVDCSRQAGLLLDCPAEKRQLIGVNLKELQQSLSLWSHRQRLLQQLIGAMDSTLQEETRQLGLELVETGLENADAAHFARARLLSCPPPTNADLAGASNLSDTLPRCRQLFSELIAVRDRIAPISQVLQELVYFEFRSKTLASDELYRVFVDQGVVAEAVTLSLQANPSALSNLVLHFQNDKTLRSACPRLPHLLTTFVKRLKTLFPAEHKATASMPRQAMPEIADTADPIVTAVEQFMVQHRRDKDKRPAKSIAADSGRQSADKQKTFILQRVNRGLLADAENALVDLVHNQARNGYPKHLCKSLCDLGQQFTSSGHYDLAKRVYFAAQIANPNDVVCWTGYAETLRELGQVKDAKAVYEQVKERFDNNAVCWTGYAETLRELGQVKEAKTVYEQAKERFDNNAVCWNGYAETLRELGQVEDAKTVYEQAKAQFPKDVYCWTGYAETLRELGRVEEAKTVYEQAKAQFDNDPVCWNGYAETLRELGRVEEAKAVYEQAKVRFDNDAVCWSGYAETLRELGQLEEAKIVYEQAKARFDNNAVCWRGYAETLRELGQVEEAKAVYKQVKKRFDNDAVSWSGYAETLRELGQLEEAKIVYEQAKARFDNNVVCWTGYAETLRELGQLEEAKIVYEQAKARFDNNVVCWTGYAETLRELGQTEEAIPIYQQTMSRFPKDRVVRNALACVLLEQGQYEEAERLLTVVQAHSLQNWHNFHVLAMIKLKQGAWKEAHAMLERGAAETPSARSRRVFQTSLAVLALRNKQPELAEGRLEITSAQIIQFPLQAVLRAHALAALRRNSEAGSLLDQVKSHRRSGQIIELAEVLVRRYGLGEFEEASPELDKEIEDREFALLLRAA